jgi:hypothetical protein
MDAERLKQALSIGLKTLKDSGSKAAAARVNTQKVFSIFIFKILYSYTNIIPILYGTILALNLKLKKDSTYEFIIQINKEFKLNDSLISVLILLSLINKKQNLKSLLVELPFSEMAIRYHLRKLILKKLLTLELDPIDKRRKNIIPTKHFFTKIKKIDQMSP